MTGQYSPEFGSRIRLAAHPTGNPILQMTPFQNGVLSTSPAGVRFHTRGGLLQTDYSTKPFMSAITAASVLGENFASTELILAGWCEEEKIVEEHSMAGQSTIAMMDIATNQLLRQSATQYPTNCMASGRVLACGTAGNTLALYDPRSFDPIRTLPGHMGGSRKVIVKGDRLLSLGYAISPSSDSNGYGRVDNVVKLFDLRTYRPLPPVLFTLGGGPADACFLPNFSSTINVVGLSGTWQTIDCESVIPGTDAYQVDLTDVNAAISAVTMSNSGDLMFFGDTMGGLHGWSDKAGNVVESLAEIQLNPYSAPISYVPPTIEPPPITMDESTPLIAMPIPKDDQNFPQDEALLSDFPGLTLNNYVPPAYPPIDDKILHMNYVIKFHGPVGYIGGIGARDRHSASRSAGFGESKDDYLHVSAVLGMGSSSMGAAAAAASSRPSSLFIPNHLPTLSKYFGRGYHQDKLLKKKTLPRHFLGGALGSDSVGVISRDQLISKEYARVTIKIPRFGLYAFDFGSYNKTSYTGLDNLLPNSYCNPILQLLYFVPSIRASMLSHLCERENCLTCELGFLFHMLDNNKGATAEPRNFLRALRQLPEVGGLGLLDMTENSTGSSSGSSSSKLVGMADDDDLFLASKIQDFWRFLLEQLHKEERESPTFQQTLADKQNQYNQMKYVKNVQQQRRHRQLTMTINQLQQNFLQLQQTLTQSNSSNPTPISVQQQQSIIDSLRQQLQHFIHQTTQAHDDYESVEGELFALQSQQMELDLMKTERTMIERIFGTQLEQKIECQGSIHHTGTRAHENILTKTVLYFKLSAYPSHDQDLTFDELLTASLQDSNGGMTQRLFCNECNTFTIQRQEKSFQCSNQHDRGGPLRAPPESTFPECMAIMANVQTDRQWDWWKKRDERFGRLINKANANATARNTKPTNLYQRFMAAGSGGDSTDSIAEESLTSLESTSDYEFKPGVVNAPNKSPPSISTNLPSTIPRASDEQMDALDVHFLPHYLLMFISRNGPSTQANDDTNSPDVKVKAKTTRVFRIQHSIAKRLQSMLSQLKSDEKSHATSVTLLTQTILATQLNVATVQQQLLVLQQQSFIVQTKLNWFSQQQQGMMSSLHSLTSQLQQSPNPQLHSILTRQVGVLQTSLHSISQQVSQLHTQKAGLVQKISAVQTAASTAAGVPNGPLSAAAVVQGGVQGLQSKVQVLQSQLAQLEQLHAEKMKRDEFEIRSLIKSHLTDARVGFHHGGGVFDPSMLDAASIDDIALYELTSVVAHIADPPEKDSPLHTINGEHLVAHIKIDHEVYDNIGSDVSSQALHLKKQLTPNSPAPSSHNRFFPSNQLMNYLASPHSPTTNSLAVTADQSDGCFPESDMRVLTSQGFMYLDEIEHKLSTGVKLEYACYDRESKSIVYRSGKLVIIPEHRRPSTLVTFTPKSEVDNWNQTVISNECDDSLSSLSVRVTGEHKMFVQQLSRDAQPEKINADDLLTRNTSEEDEIIRFQTYAVEGLNRSDSFSKQLSATLAAFRLPQMSAPQMIEFLKLAGFGIGNAQSIHTGSERLNEWIESVKQAIEWNHIDSTRSGAFDQFFQPSNSTVDTAHTLANLLPFLLSHGDGIHMRAVVDGIRIASETNSQRTVDSSSGSIRVASSALCQQLMIVFIHAGYAVHINNTDVNDWVVRWSHHQPELRRGEVSRMAYQPKQDGRIWCVTADHDDHLIIAQRAIRQPETGAIMRQSIPIIIGQSWTVFNDFVIRPSNGFEATRFSYQWKQPCAVVYKLMNPNVSATTNEVASPPPVSPPPAGPGTLLPTNNNRSTRLENPFMNEHMIYSYGPSLAVRYRESMRSFQPLIANGPNMERIDSNTLVAIDCEFVSVQHELLERDDDTGENVVVRPARLTLARVSVVRGSGPLAGVPFIDDYIATPEPVVDYLTKFSGIAPGDLDRATSTHHLTTLKHAYVRLRALIERGVKFIGHGLKKDLQVNKQTIGNMNRNIVRREFNSSSHSTNAFLSILLL